MKLSLERTGFSQEEEKKIFSFKKDPLEIRESIKVVRVKFSGQP